jgi:hypothetical protein
VGFPKLRLELKGFPKMNLGFIIFLLLKKGPAQSLIT